ncbi:hypothetical protein [Flavobacterium ginsenosidimutans]|uniref:Uncharacterized protein n=1 Tax=Flavobacterium ginsenosidimutans TaxID=687844 RepID=A0ABZ2QD62_9FLAO|nr:hypothetical protein [Flavobacterium ginsenosidimutans]KAF2334674.1 hypothetical protein DM444_05700 [Flavobacterium ginsenosidimutans]
MNNPFFEKINNIEWFSNCGKEFSIADFPIKIKFMKSFDEMQKNIISQNWEDLTMEARNRLTVFLHKNNRNDYQDWNRITEINKSNLKQIETTAKFFVEKNNLDKSIIDDVLWNVLGAAMEDHYILINKRIPIFFNYLLEIYSQGNIPCGLIGEVKEDFDGNSIDFSDFTILVY